MGDKMEALIQIAQSYTPKIEKALIVLAKGKDDPSEGSFEKPRLDRE